MVKKSSPRAAIEGREILIRAQKITPTGIPRPTKTNGIVFPVQASRRASGSITQESNPKVAKIRDYSLLDMDDEISGQNLWGFSSFPLSRDNIQVGKEGRTGAHPGQDVTLNGTFCFLEIVSGWYGLPLKSHPRLELLA